jgi:hypothetical protein
MTVLLQLFAVCLTVMYVNGWLLPPNGFILDFNSEQINYDSIVFHLPPILTNTNRVKAVQQIKHLRYIFHFVVRFSYHRTIPRVL